MKRSIGILIAVFTVLCTSFAVALAADRFTITRVYDGDTVRAESGQIVIYIMLVGIDAPEVADEVHKRGQPFGKQAMDFLAGEILNRSVEVEGYGVAPFPHDNIIGVIRRDGRNINLEMVKKGLAEVQREDLPKGLDIAPYLDAEREARAGKVGMWALGDQYMSPKEWRLKYMSHVAGTKEK
jgi:endonuclease YncB( thermonuclease family)